MGKNVLCRENEGSSFSCEVSARTAGDRHRRLISGRRIRADRFTVPNSDGFAVWRLSLPGRDELARSTAGAENYAFLHTDEILSGASIRQRGRNL